MSRRFAENINDDIKGLLSTLINEETNSSVYAGTMYKLGENFGRIILSRIQELHDVTLACTVEDADYLGRGIIDVLEKSGKKVLLTVFWNKRYKPNKENRISIAPIIKEFHERGYNKARTLIIIKSIISSSCVVRTNLTKLIDEANFDEIFVVAPVLMAGSTSNLESEFDESISNKFQYIYFAEDNEKTDEGIVLPGIGGDVYKRLGFEGQDAKNRLIPQIVKERRFQQAN